MNPLRIELNNARDDYQDKRERLGHLNKVIGTKRIGHFQIEVSNEVLVQLKRDKSRVFGEMNKARARLRRAIKAVETIVTRKARGSYIGLARLHSTHNPIQSPMTV